MTKKEALSRFREDTLPYVPSNDIPAKCEAWNNYTDALCKAGEITLRQYESWTNPF